MGLLDKEKEILEEKDSIGNAVLYDLCAKHPLKENNKEGALSAQMWLIGRSYAASPERRSYGVGSITNGGNGLDTFFNDLEREIVRHSKYKDFIKTLSKLDGEYSFSEVEKDLEKLKITIECVNNLNQIIKDARLEVDKIVLGDMYEIAKKNQKGLISFCSKFLHFHFPKLFFIKDSIAESHLTYNDNSKKICKFIFDIDKESCIQINKSDVDKYCQNNKDAYAIHCVKEYLLGKQLKQIGNINPTPRIIDRYVLNANIKNVKRR